MTDKPNDPVPAPQQPAAPPDPLIQAKERALKLAELDAKIAEQQKNARAALLATGDAKPLEGKLTIDDKVTIECEIQTYTAVDHIAKKIADKLKPIPLDPLVVYNDRDVAALGTYQLFTVQVKRLGSTFKAIAPPKPRSTEMFVEATTLVGATVAATGVAKALTDLLAFMREDVDIKGKDITVEEVSLVSGVANHLSEKTIHYPALLPTGIITDGSMPITSALEELQREKAAAESRVALLPVEDKATSQAQLTDTTTRLAAFEGNLLQADVTTGVPPLASAIRGAAMVELLGVNGGLLYLKPVHAGGSNRITRRLWSGSTLSHSGGAIANMMLFDRSGRLVASEIFSAYTGYVKFDEK